MVSSREDRAGDEVQLVQGLPSMCAVLGSVPSTPLTGHHSVITALGRLKQDDRKFRVILESHHEFKASLGYVRPFLRTQRGLPRRVLSQYISTFLSGITN